MEARDESVDRHTGMHRAWCVRWRAQLAIRRRRQVERWRLRVFGGRSRDAAGRTHPASEWYFERLRRLIVGSTRLLRVRGGDAVREVPHAVGRPGRDRLLQGRSKVDVRPARSNVSQVAHEGRGAEATEHLRGIRTAACHRQSCALHSMENRDVLHVRAAVRRGSGQANHVK